jgi:hypothetical protein
MASCVSTVLQQRSDGWGFYLGDYKVTLMRPNRFLDSLHTTGVTVSPNAELLPALPARHPAGSEGSELMYVHCRSAEILYLCNPALDSRLTIPVRGTVLYSTRVLGRDMDMVVEKLHASREIHEC